MPMIKVVLFDLGSTLVYQKDPWPPIYERADRALVDALASSGIRLDLADFHTDSRGFLGTYYESTNLENREYTTFNLLGDTLGSKGFSNTSEPVLRSALAAMYAVTQQNWYLEEDALSTLAQLNKLGYKLGLISNTSDDNNVQGLVDRWRLRPYFETIITSAALGIRKPDPRIFQVALERLHVLPQEAAMVGDTLNADVLGANQSGMYSIWITRRIKLPDEGELEIQPQAVVSALQQIPALLAEIEKDQAN
jgi:HAD superfamily hydrolase (TIGR01662 family)